MVVLPATYLSVFSVTPLTNFDKVSGGVQCMIGKKYLLRLWWQSGSRYVRLGLHLPCRSFALSECSCYYN